MLFLNGLTDPYRPDIHCTTEENATNDEIITLVYRAARPKNIALIKSCRPAQ